MPRTLARILALAWMGLIYYLSDRPSIDVEEFFSAQDKVAHAIVFGILAILYLLSMQRSTEGYRLHRLWIAVGLTAAYGIFDEVHQAFVPNRTADVWDVVADTIGGLIAVYLVYRAVKSSRLEGAPTDKINGGQGR